MKQKTLLLPYSFFAVALLSAVCTVHSDGVEQQISDCINFDKSTFSKDNASIVVLEARGRLGNHLMAYTVLNSLRDEFKARAYIFEDTFDLVSKYFRTDNGYSPQVLQHSFCNWHEIPFTSYFGSIDELVTKDQHLFKGHLVNLWPGGYMADSKVCCPAQDLMNYMLKTNVHNIQEGLEILPKFQDAAQKTLHQIADSLSISPDGITFVGIHNRRTDYIAYMQDKYDMKPLKKSYFKAAMNHFRDDLSDEDTKVVFVYVSDDMEWGRQNIKSKAKDVFFVGKGDGDDEEAIGYDLALLAACNSTIIARGSFSTWAAILSGGEYYSDYGPSVLPHKQNQKRKKRKKKVEL